MTDRFKNPGRNFGQRQLIPKTLVAINGYKVNLFLWIDPHWNFMR